MILTECHKSTGIHSSSEADANYVYRARLGPLWRGQISDDVSAKWKQLRKKGQREGLVGIRDTRSVCLAEG
jgi:hypothetical protein